MVDKTQIPNLVKLLDDESPQIQEKVIQELSAFGPNLKQEIKNLSIPVNSIQKGLLNSILHRMKRLEIRRVWGRWYRLKEEHLRLEQALSLLSHFLEEGDSSKSLSKHLDELAMKYNRKYRTPDHLQLAKFLFKDLGLKGNQKDYYNPQNSNLIHVLRSRRGIPISLASIYILVGARINLTIEGCHFPGHFLARVPYNGRNVFIDCFGAGQVIEEKDILEVRKDMGESIKQILHERADALTVIQRFLANLIRAFETKGEQEDCDLMIELFKDLEHKILSLKVANLTPEYFISGNEPSYVAGQVVAHCRYGYRGIVVDFDLQCNATDSWYYGNQTQPDRNQSWYHVLVDGSDQVTYVAESNLHKDKIKKTVAHPLLNYFFSRSEEGKYVRNDNPWPETDF